MLYRTILTTHHTQYKYCIGLYVTIILLRNRYIVSAGTSGHHKILLSLLFSTKFVVISVCGRDNDIVVMVPYHVLHEILYVEL